MIVTPESRATVSSMPVPTSGASARSSGTAWRCMLEPMRARLASSFSRKGMSAAAPAGDQIGDEALLGIELGIGLGDGEPPFLHGREIDGLVGHRALVDLA